ncbi:MAG: helix-hairpin-helix domain-containing protein, partial [Thermonemataceae bacterium]|nr:helix-hairpin-helix domain-containing protein [Thermonemataceae bacterium]
MKKYLSISFLMVWSLIWQAQAQPYPRKEIDIKKFVEELFAVQDQDEDTNYEDIYEALYQLYLEPLNLNKATKEDLAQLFILNEIQITNLLSHIQKNGKLLSIYELQAVEGFDLDTIYKILPFVNVENSENADARPLFKRIIEEDNRYLIMRYQVGLEKEKGFSEEATPSTKYLGSRPRLYTRFRTSHSKDFSIGFTMEKDEGEQILWQPQQKFYGADFLSYHAFFENKGRFKQIVLGDYQIQVGQSILLAAGFNVGKGAEAVQIRRANIGIKPFTSLLEAGFMRGAAVNYNLLKSKKGELDVLAFASFT